MKNNIGPITKRLVISIVIKYANRNNNIAYIKLQIEEIKTRFFFSIQVPIGIEKNTELIL